MFADIAQRPRCFNKKAADGAGVILQLISNFRRYRAVVEAEDYLPAATSLFIVLLPPIFIDERV